MNYTLTLYSFDDIAREKNLRYCIIGGLAVGVWGELRFTADIDYAISIEQFEVLKGVMELIEYELVFTHPKMSFAHFSPRNKKGSRIDIMIVDSSTWGKLNESISLINLGDGKMLPVVGYLHLISMKLHAAKQSDRENPLKDLMDIVSIAKQQKLTFEDIESAGIINKYGTEDIITRLRELFSTIRS